MPRRPLSIGIACDLRSDFELGNGDPEDSLEEYDSEATVNAIAEALRSAGHSARILGGGRRFVEAILSDPPELIFNIAEGRGGRAREAQVPAVAEMLGIPSTHSDSAALAVALDKSAAKEFVKAAGLPTPRSAIFRPGVPFTAELAFPLIVKPLHEGSSMGIRNDSLVDSRDELLRRAGELARDYRQPVLVEEFCSGPEITVGISGAGDNAIAIAAMEIAPSRVPSNRFIYSLEVKRDFRTEVDYHVPPRVTEATRSAAIETALGAYRALGCRDIGRVDLRLDREGRPNFLEINPLPGLNPETGDIVILAGRVGISFSSLVSGIVEDARIRLNL